MVFNKSAKTMQWGKDSLFKKWCYESYISTCKTTKVDPNLTTVDSNKEYTC